MSKDIKKEAKPKIKFTLNQALHRTLKVDLLMDIVVGEEVVENYPVGWVRIRGSQDPQYLKDIIPKYTKFREKMDDSHAIEDLVERKTFLEDATVELHTDTVTVSILEWDEEFFGHKFSPEKALEIFKNDNYSVLYNQIAHAMQKREDFLPLVSLQQENG